MKLKYVNFFHINNFTYEKALSPFIPTWNDYSLLFLQWISIFTWNESPFIMESIIRKLHFQLLCCRLFHFLYRFVLYMFNESRKYYIKVIWICLLVLCTIGLSAALPLFLFLRQTYMENTEKSH